MLKCEQTENPDFQAVVSDLCKATYERYVWVYEYHGRQLQNAKSHKYRQNASASLFSLKVLDKDDIAYRLWIKRSENKDEWISQSYRQYNFTV